MRLSTRIILSVLIVGFLLTGMVARGFHPKEMVHDLDHHGQTSVATLDSAHRPLLESRETPKSESFDEVEHQLFHAVSTLHLLASAAPSFFWDAVAQILVPALNSPSLPVAELEPPFRPPRSSAFI